VRVSEEIPPRSSDRRDVDMRNATNAFGKPTYVERRHQSEKREPLIQELSAAEILE